MKILYLHQYFNTPDMKGGTRSYEMARRMVAAGHEVHMVTSRKDGSLKEGVWKHEVIDGINVHWLPVEYNNNMSYLRRIVAFFKFALKAGKKAINIGGDIIFATSTPLTIAIPAVQAKKKLRVPIVFEVRDLWPELPIAIGALKSPVTKYLAKKLELFAYKHSDHVVGLSPDMCEGVIKAGYPRSKVSNIPNSCDFALFEGNEDAGKQFRRENEWLGNRPLVLYTGTLGHINKVSYLVEVAHQMLKIDSNVRFLILGDGVEEKKIMNLAIDLGVFKKNLFMIPKIPKKEVPSVISAATVCTSLFAPIKEMWANSANKFFDALASKKPIVINYGGWQKDLMLEEGFGLVLPEADYLSAAEQLYAFISDNNKLENNARKGYEVGKRLFARDKLAAELIQVLENTQSYVKDKR